MFTCLNCNATARTRTSMMISKETRRSYHQCTNMLCGQSFTTLETEESYLNNVTPPAKAHIIPAGAFPRSNCREDQLNFLL
ncbi:ogr/Delta-like zinc finger family protein [Pantoea sp.]|uniref:ogr/Delta-like zinc finger family protein n=1 Tax=Pantoea sp. TaxID=69393 RepID=UPI0025D07EB9|nr:ogr/Delta-like zinc finger family protein [Pantoea sp.]